MTPDEKSLESVRAEWEEGLTVVFKAEKDIRVLVILTSARTPKATTGAGWTQRRKSPA